MERVSLKSRGTSAGPWVNPVSSPVEGWGRHTWSRGEAAVCVTDTAGCQVTCVCLCVWMTHHKISVVYLKDKNLLRNVPALIGWLCFLCRTPSPPEYSRRRACGPNQEEDSLPGHDTPPTRTDIVGTGSLTSRGQLGSRPHTPVGRVDIRPHDDPVMVPQTLYYAPASPKLEFKSTPNTPITERWQNLSKVRTFWVFTCQSVITVVLLEVFSLAKENKPGDVSRVFSN